MAAIDSYCAPPVGYKAIELRDDIEFFLNDSDEERFLEIDVQSEGVPVMLPVPSDDNNGDTFWIAESGGQGGIVMNDENMTTINPATLAAFVSRGTHWECIASDLPWSSPRGEWVRTYPQARSKSCRVHIELERSPSTRRHTRQ